MATVRLYRREGCTLCDHARSLLDELAPRLGFEVEDVDIELDDTLLKRYMFEIPVVAVDETVIARAPIRRAVLESNLEAVLGDGRNPRRE